MMKEPFLRGLVEEALAYAKELGVSQAEATSRTLAMDVTRYAANHIHQNSGFEAGEVSVRVIIGKRSGSASTGETSVQGVHKAVEQAVVLANLREEDPLYPGLPEPEEIPPCEGWSEATASCSAADRAAVVASAINESRRLGFTAAGVYATGTECVAMGNSLGLRCFHPSTTYSFTVTSMSPTSSGFAGSTGWDVRRFEPGPLAESAVRKADMAQNPIMLEPGEYEVVLEPEASGVLFGFFSRLAMSGRSYEQGVSCVSGRLGQRILGSNLTFWDDGYDSRGLPKPFDIEGVPKRKLMLVENGVAKNVCYDSYTAGLRPGLKSTGHAMPFNPYESGPLPSNVFVQPGAATVQDMIQSTRRGLWVSRFHYTNAIDYRNVIVTGITRDALFLIDNGKIVAPVRTMRFTENVVQALNDVDMLGSRVHYLGGYRGGVAAPAVKIRKFRFIA